MGRAVMIAVGLVVMIALIVGFDFLLFRENFWARLLSAVGIVLIFGALYLRFAATT
jgi:hypothetical protein